MRVVRRYRRRGLVTIRHQPLLQNVELTIDREIPAANLRHFRWHSDCYLASA
jgi:hypothetical protein